MGVMDERGMPVPSYKKDHKRVAGTLRKHYKGMLDYLLLQLAFNPDDRQTIRQAEIMRQVNYMLKDLDDDMYREVNRTVKKAFGDGQAYHLLSVEEAESWDDAVSSSSFNQIQRGKVQALVEDTYDDILLATGNTSEAVRSVVRDTVRDVSQYHSLQNNGYIDQAKDLRQRLTKQGLSERVRKDGFVGIVDRKGRKWDLETYSNMVVRTKTSQALKEGIMEESLRTGFDLAVISDHGAVDACSDWEGVIISMHGKTEGFPTYDDVRATNEIFHPNCEHTMHPIRSLDMLPDDEVRRHWDKLRKLGDYQNRVYRRI